MTAAMRPANRFPSIVLGCELSLQIFSLLLSFTGVEGSTVSGFPSTVPVGSTFDSSHSFYMQSQNGRFQLEFQSWEVDAGVEQCMGGVRYVLKTPNAFIWTFNSTDVPQPVNGSDCTLSLRSDGVLALTLTRAASSERVVAWQTPTAGMRVQNLTLQDNGNLVLQDDTGFIVWQSFTYFRHLFLIPSGLRFFQNMTLYDRVPLYADFSTPGCYAMRMGSGGRLLLLTRANMYVYHSIGIPNSTSSAVPEYVIIEQDIDFYSSQGSLLGSVPHNVRKNDPLPNGTDLIGSALFKNGNLMINRPSPGTNPHNHLWYYNSSIQNHCDLPLTCGEYGLCNEADGSCSCPIGFRISHSKTVCTSDDDASRKCSCPQDFDNMPAFNSTCEPVDPAYTLQPVNVSFFPQPSSIPVLSDRECRTLCERNVSCNAALFDSNSSSCALFPIIYTLRLPSPHRATGGQVMFLKITASNRRNRPAVAIIISTTIAGAVLIVGVVCLSAWRWWWISRIKRFQAQERFLQELSKLPPRFSYKDLLAATGDFSKRLGVGGYGSVYEGVLNTPAGTVKVAVKRLDQGEGSAQCTMENQFQAEVATIGSVSHVNLVTLKGFCMEKHARLLVFEFMSRGSLDRWLFGPESSGRISGQPSLGGSARELLNWKRRCIIALDTAKGLEYLHHELEEHIVHCDVKAANILLDEGFRAKVGDFGLAKLMGSDIQSFAMTTLKGTRGYLAPEWLHHATISAKSDVYSYGIVLLELITGKRSLDPEYGHLPTWIMRMMSVDEDSTTLISDQDFDTKKDASLLKDTIMDERLPRHNVPTADFQRVLMLALACVQVHPTDRPSMASVVQTLEDILEISCSPPTHRLGPYSFPLTGSGSDTSITSLSTSSIPVGR